MYCHFSKKTEMRYLVTGGCGFIGSNFILKCLEKEKDVRITNIDAMHIGSNSMNLENIRNPNYRFVKGNICNKKLMEKLIENVDCVINFAAESHVDRSIKDAQSFIQSNIIGVHTILGILKNKKKIKFLQISTDEVYGELLKGKNLECDELNPSNPYSATKASAEMLVRSYGRTYNLDTIITRCTNNYGPRQFPEKLIPKTIVSALRNEPIPLHGDGNAKRQWIHVFDHCNALLKILSRWKKSSIYNISANYETTNISLVKKMLKMMNKSENLLTFVPDRPGQDRRYGINSNLIKKDIGFTAKIKLEEGLESTIKWYMSNKKWWQNIMFKKISNPNPQYNA